MSNQNLVLEDTEENEICLGLVSLAKSIPDFEFFFKLNSINSFCFQRIEDLTISGKYFRHHFPVFEGYSKETKTCYRFITNKSSETEKLQELTELFTNEHENEMLLPHFPEADFLLTSSDAFADFSLILLPENLTFPMQEMMLGSNDELYQTIQYYE